MRPSQIPTIPETDVQQLQEALSGINTGSRVALRVSVILKIAECQQREKRWTIVGVARDLGTTPLLIGRVVADYTEGGVTSVLDSLGTRKMRSATTEEMLKTLEELSAESPPERAPRGRWSTQLLAEELGKRGHPCCSQTVSQALRLIHRQNGRHR